MNPRHLSRRISVTSTAIVTIVAISALGGTAVAARQAGLIGGAQIANNAIASNHVKNASLTGADLKNGSLTVNELSSGAREALSGADGADGAQGPKGDTGAQGPKGDTGATGADGAAAPAAEYGVASVWVNRKSGGVYVAASRWAQYTAELGAPVSVGNTTGGDFRFTCNASHAPCKVSLKATVLSSTSTADAKVYARLLMTRYTDAAGTDLGNDKVAYCEYADGADNAGGRSTIGREPMNADVALVSDPLTMGIGGSLDCGSAQAHTPTVTEIEVPVGYYDVSAGFQFYVS